MNQNNPVRKKQLCMKLILLVAVNIIFVIMLSSQVLALGVSPGRVTLNFEPYLHKEIELKVINNEHKDMRVMLGVIGELSDYVTLNTKSIDFSSSETEKTFTYIVNLPEKIATPGGHEAKIAVAELPPEGLEEGVYIGATIVVTSQLLIKVPYPHKYAEISLNVEKVDVNETAIFYVEVDNLGKQDLVNMQATIEILSPTNQKIAILKTDTKTIEAESKSELTATWKANVNPGNYRAIASLAYDEGKIATGEKVFLVGSMQVEIVDISVRDFTLGEIAKFDITIENRWGEEIKNIYAQLQIEDANKNLIANVKTPSVDLDPLSRSVLNAYWDTAGVQEGTYSGRLLLNYADQVLERKLKTEITLNSIKVEILGVGITAKATAAEVGRQNLMFILVIVLILINLAWFIYFKRREKKK
jgi:hypothetical protein